MISPLAQTTDEAEVTLIRVAIFEGVIEAGSEDAFFMQVSEHLKPIWRSFPYVLDVRVLRTRQSEPGAIPIVMVLEMDLPDLDAIHASLHSDIKTRAHATTLKVLKPAGFPLHRREPLGGTG